MKAHIIRKDSLQVELTLSPSEASALCTLLDCGYDWAVLGHDWDPLIVILASFTDEQVLKRIVKGFPFSKDGSGEVCHPSATEPAQPSERAPKRLDHRLSGVKEHGGLDGQGLKTGHNGQHES